MIVLPACIPVSVKLDFFSSFFRRLETVFSTIKNYIGLEVRYKFIISYVSHTILPILDRLVHPLINLKHKNTFFHQIPITNVFLKLLMIISNWVLIMKILWYILHIRANFHLHRLFYIYQIIKFWTLKRDLFSSFLTIHKRFSKIEHQIDLELENLDSLIFVQLPTNFHITLVV